MFAVKTQTGRTFSGKDVDPRGDRVHGEDFRDRSSTLQSEYKDILTINVSGLRFQVTSGTLSVFPDSLLGDSNRRAAHYNEETGEYFFERSRVCFDSILYYYQSRGVLCCPRNVPPQIFYEEVKFFELGDDVAEPFETFAGRYNKYDTDDETEKDDESRMRSLWILFEKPNSSVAAKMMTVLSMLVILLSVTVFCIETIPSVSDSTSCLITTGNGTNMTSSVNYHCGVFFIIETVCVAWFTIEFFCRLVSSPCKQKFFKNFLNVIDLVAILPYYITLPLDNSEFGSLSVVRIVRLVRVFRVFKLSRYLRGFIVLARALRESIAELLLLVLFMGFGVILFASAIYYAERSANSENFSSIPEAFWWATITMTTVGYGDRYPITVVGRFIGAACAVVGVLFMAMPIPVIVQNFTALYNLERELAARKASRQREKHKLGRMKTPPRDLTSEDKMIIKDFREAPSRQASGGTGSANNRSFDHDLEFAAAERRRTSSFQSYIDPDEDLPAEPYLVCPKCGFRVQESDGPVPARRSIRASKKSILEAREAVLVRRRAAFARITQEVGSLQEHESPPLAVPSGNGTTTPDANACAVLMFREVRAPVHDGDSAPPSDCANGKPTVEVETSV